MFCENCGSKIKDGSTFCENCGSPVKVKAPQSVSYVQEAPDTRELPPPAPIRDEGQTYGNAYGNGNGDTYDNAYGNGKGDTYGEVVYGQPAGPAKGRMLGLSIASMCCGIVSLLLCFVTPYGFVVSIVLAIIAIVFGLVSVSKSFRGKGMAIAGSICGFVYLFLLTLILIAVLAFGVSFFDDSDKEDPEYEIEDFLEEPDIDMDDTDMEL